MRKAALHSALLAILLSAAPAFAQTNKSNVNALTVTYGTTSGSPAEANPNTTPPAAAKILTVDSMAYADRLYRVPPVNVWVTIDHDETGAAPSCTVVPWKKDETSSFWRKMESQTAVAVAEEYKIRASLKTQVFFQISTCGGSVTIDDDHPLTLYAGVE